jgi:hypothetical protein
MTTLTLVTVCGLLALVAVAALGATLVSRSKGGVAGARSWPITLAPAPDDLSLAQISFHPASRGRLPASSLAVALGGPFGSDYLAAATPRFATRGDVDALVVLVNRPSPLLDPASVRLRIGARRSLGVPTMHALNDPFARPASARRPALCDLPLHAGAALTAGELSAVRARGAPLPGFDADDAVAQAYDAVCGLPYESAFKRAVQSAGAVSPQPPPSTSTTPESPATTPESPATTPESPSGPVGKLPGEGCKPTPGYACPG